MVTAQRDELLFKDIPKAVISRQRLIQPQIIMSHPLIRSIFCFLPRPPPLAPQSPPKSNSPPTSDPTALGCTTSPPITPRVIRRLRLWRFDLRMLRVSTSSVPHHFLLLDLVLRERLRLINHFGLIFHPAWIDRRQPLQRLLRSRSSKQRLHRPRRTCDRPRPGGCFRGRGGRHGGEEGC